jgi:hypothetical protein
MHSETSTVPKWFWVVSILALLWYLMDMSAFFMRAFMLDDMLRGMPETQKQLYLKMPFWVNLVFAAEVFGGVLGCVGLLLKKKWSLNFFGISIAGVLIQTSYVYFMSNAIDVMGAAAIMMPLVAILIGSGLIVFTKSAIAKNWVH